MILVLVFLGWWFAAIVVILALWYVFWLEERRDQASRLHAADILVSEIDEYLMRAERF